MWLSVYGCVALTECVSAYCARRRCQRSKRLAAEHHRNTHWRGRLHIPPTAVLPVIDMQTVAPRGSRYDGDQPDVTVLRAVHTLTGGVIPK